MAEEKKGGGSRIVMVSSREEHEKQATTLAAFVQSMTSEFMNSFSHLDQQALRQRMADASRVANRADGEEE